MLKVCQLCIFFVENTDWFYYLTANSALDKNVSSSIFTCYNFHNQHNLKASGNIFNGLSFLLLNYRLINKSYLKSQEYYNYSTILSLTGKEFG
jgi:hypothetical protein